MAMNAIDVNIIMNHRRLRHLNRCNNFARNVGEDVAQHSYFVSLLSMMIGDELNLNDDFVENHRDVNVELIMRKALLHDTEEAITSDVPYNVKNHSSAFKSKLNSVLTEISKAYYEGASDSLLEYHKIGADCKEGLEGQVVDIADMLELALYCFEEVNTGNAFMKGLMDRAMYLVTTKPLYPYSEISQKLVEFISSADKESIAKMTNL